MIDTTTFDGRGVPSDPLNLLVDNVSASEVSDHLAQRFDRGWMAFPASTQYIHINGTPQPQDAHLVRYHVLHDVSRFLGRNKTALLTRTHLRLWAVSIGNDMSRDGGTESGFSVVGSAHLEDIFHKVIGFDAALAEVVEVLTALSYRVVRHFDLIYSAPARGTRLAY